LVLWGPSGTGKSKLAYELMEAQNEQFYAKVPFNTWWDGYEGEANVLIDEYAGQWPLDYLLVVLDRYRVRAEIKGTTWPLSATTFIITSNLHPTDWYPTAREEHKAALMRRCNNIVHSDDMAAQAQTYFNTINHQQQTSNSNSNPPAIVPIDVDEL